MSKLKDNNKSKPQTTLTTIVKKGSVYPTLLAKPTGKPQNTEKPVTPKQGNKNKSK